MTMRRRTYRNVPEAEAGWWESLGWEIATATCYGSGQISVLIRYEAGIGDDRSPNGRGVE